MQNIRECVEHIQKNCHCQTVKQFSLNQTRNEQCHCCRLHLKKRLKKKLPKDLLHIILEAGFDSELAIISINSDNIKEIEIYANENKQILEETIYSRIITSNTTFKER